MNIVLKTKELLQDVIEKEGYTLADLLYEKEGNNHFLRIIIDKPGYITIDDCLKVTSLVNPILDENDYIEDSYILDVCSKEKGCE